MNKNDIVNLKIDGIDYLGEGIAHNNGQTIICKNAILYEEVEALILKSNKNITFAKSSKIIKPSKYRIEPACPYFKLCGGCSMLHIDYKYQIEMKKKMVETTLNKMIKGIKIDSIISSDNPFNYRNKIQVPIGFKDENFIKGFYRENSHDIIPSENCLIEPVISKEVFDKLLPLLKKHNVLPYDENTNSGEIRHILLRTNNKNDVMIVFVSRENISGKINNILNEIDFEFKSVYLNINDKQTNVVVGKEFIHIKNELFIEEEINGIKFDIHPNSFFQVNHSQMVKLYNKGIEILNLNKDDVVIDAYSGIGSISLNLAKQCKQVYGIEVVKESVDNANNNKKVNNINNVEFILGKCEDEIANLVKNKTINAIVVDPPRKGCDQSFLETIIDSKIEKILYISCNPSSLGRDLKILSEFYSIEEVHLVDMFSHSHHVESVVKLLAKKSA
ncbi:MAG: 23S rRNA (uracil(1939)-C(5))-methyltransferase RlmD [bacterium]